MDHSHTKQDPTERNQKKLIRAFVFEGDLSEIHGCVPALNLDKYARSTFLSDVSWSWWAVLGYASPIRWL